ncbi:hypothetical protein ScPMuIL_002803 [Solemya velum]
MLSIQILLLSLSLNFVSSYNSINVLKPLSRQPGDRGTLGFSENEVHRRLLENENTLRRLERVNSHFLKTKDASGFRTRLSNLEKRVKELGAGLKKQQHNYESLRETMPSPRKHIPSSHNVLEKTLQDVPQTYETRKDEQRFHTTTLGPDWSIGQKREKVTAVPSNVLLDDTVGHLVSFNPDVADCADIKVSKSGVYRIYPRGLAGGCDVYCDMETDGGGWTVIQRRNDGSENFDRVWGEYETGFGSLSGEYWLGNAKIHRLTSQGDYQLRIDLETFEGDVAYAIYGEFRISDASTNYYLAISDYSGNAGDSLQHHNGYQFSTRDRDNDGWPRGSCAKRGGGWWYYYCFKSNLNAPYNQESYVWRNRNPEFTLKATEMKIRRVDNP